MKKKKFSFSNLSFFKKIIYVLLFFLIFFFVFLQSLLDLFIFIQFFLGVYAFRFFLITWICIKKMLKCFYFFLQEVFYFFFPFSKPLLLEINQEFLKVELFKVNERQFRWALFKTLLIKFFIFFTTNSIVFQFLCLFVCFFCYDFSFEFPLFVIFLFFFFYLVCLYGGYLFFILCRYFFRHLIILFNNIWFYFYFFFCDFVSDVLLFVYCVFDDIPDAQEELQEDDEDGEESDARWFGDYLLPSYPREFLRNDVNLLSQITRDYQENLLLPYNTLTYIKMEPIVMQVNTFFIDVSINALAGSGPEVLIVISSFC